MVEVKCAELKVRTKQLGSFGGSLQGMQSSEEEEEDGGKTVGARQEVGVCEADGDYKMKPFAGRTKRKRRN